MRDLDLDWYTYLTEDFKKDRNRYKTVDYAVVDCPICGKADSIRISHLKAKIKRIGKYECSKCRKSASIKRARDAFKAKHGNVNPFQLEPVKDKIKATNLERYGAESVLALKEYRNAALKGTSYTNISQKPEVKAKISASMKRRVKLPKSE